MSGDSAFLHNQYNKRRLTLEEAGATNSTINNPDSLVPEPPPYSALDIDNKEALVIKLEEWADTVEDCNELASEIGLKTIITVLNDGTLPGDDWYGRGWNDETIVSQNHGHNVNAIEWCKMQFVDFASSDMKCTSAIKERLVAVHQHLSDYS